MRDRRAEAAYDAGAVVHRREAGHEVVAARPTVSALVRHADGLVGYVELAGLTRRERSRVARHDALLAMVTDGRMTAAAFRRRVDGWVPVAGLQLVSDPAAAKAAADVQRQLGEPLGPYPEGAGR